MYGYCAIRNIWHEGCGRERDIARGEAECYIIARDHTQSAIYYV